MEHFNEAVLKNSYSQTAQGWLDGFHKLEVRWFGNRVTVFAH